MQRIPRDIVEGVDHGDNVQGGIAWGDTGLGGY